MQASILLLGSGQDGGSPQMAKRRGVGLDRTASSAAVVSAAGSVVLLDASPDIRAQSRRLLSWYGYPPGRSRFVDAVVISHAHMGHYAGLLHFGKEVANTSGIPLIATPSVLRFLNANQPWEALTENGNLLPTPFDGVVRIDETLSLVPIVVPHRAEYTDTVAISVLRDGEPWFLYLPDIDGWEEWPEADEVIASHDLCLLDATFATSEEVSHRDISVIKHPLVLDTISRFEYLTTSTNIILGHMNHTNPLADPTSDIARFATEAGFTIASDGLSLAP